MLEAQRQWLPQFAGKLDPRDADDLHPARRQPVDVPLDPALAIHKRFGKLVSQKTD